MPSESANVARTRDLFSAMGSRDVAAFDALVADTVSITLFPETLRFVIPGKAAPFANLKQLTADGTLKFELIELIDAPATGQVIAHVKGVDTLAKDGVTPFCNEYIFIFTFEDGRIVRWKEFMDSAYIAEFLAGQKIPMETFRSKEGV